MTSKFEALKKEVSDLCAQGNLLCFALMKDANALSAGDLKIILERRGELPDFNSGYNIWYSEALRVVKQILPDRLADFTLQYRDEKRKQIDHLTYGISDALLGLTTRRGGQIVAEAKAAVPKMANQVSILKAAEKRFSSSLFDIRDVVQADLFDSELDAARSLAKSGFLRACGAVGGVVLEKHLGHVCATRGLKSKKGHPTISDFNDMLKAADLIDVVKWRFIQHLGDIRNLCDHGKDREPTKEEVLELIDGVDKVIKTVF